MKNMENTRISDYAIYCTPEQTKKALELGAPIETYEPRIIDSKAGGSFTTPTIETVTAEQMIGWLEEQESIISIEIIKCDGYWQGYVETTNYKDAIGKHGYSSRKGATIAVIDAALDYMAKNKNV